MTMSMFYIQKKFHNCCVTWYLLSKRAFRGFAKVSNCCFILTIPSNTDQLNLLKFSVDVFFLLVSYKIICSLPCICVSEKSMAALSGWEGLAQWLQSSEYCMKQDPTFIWGNVFKNGPSKICEIQPLKILKGYGLLKQTISLQTF